MIPPAEEICLTFSAPGSNAEPYLGEGWRRAEDGRRWTEGLGSVVRLPPMRARPWFVLTFDAETHGGAAQPLTIRLNGAEIGQYLPKSAIPFDIVVPGDLVSAESENRLEINQPAPGSTDTRKQALAFRQLTLAPLVEPLHATPLALPEVAAPTDRSAARTVTEAFQSLGQHCDLGLVQRRYGAEPFGLLRFASIFPDRLIAGLRTRFAGVGDVAALSYFLPEGRREWDGMHAFYGLAYHTFKTVDEIDAASLAAKEGPRLEYLARLLIEQLETNEKIFVRVENFETVGEALALHRLLQTFHAQARLFLLQAAPPDAPERIGRVYELRPGLYRGYLSRRSDIAGTRDPALYEEWLRLCATIMAYEEARRERDTRARDDAQEAFDYSQRALGGRAAPPPPADDLRLIFAGEGRNAEPYLGEGWSAAEPEFRWTEGVRSIVWLPPMRPRAWLALTLQCAPFDLGGAKQRLTIRLNGARLRSFENANVPLHRIAVPGDLVRQDRENLLILDLPDAARPSEIDPGNPDNRLLALAFQSLEFGGLDEPLRLAPRLLPKAAPPTTPASAKALVETFQSLGFNCDLGLLQRHFGAEPYGLLRFASIRHDRLVMGLKTRFAGIGDPTKLSFFLEPDNRQLMGRHAVYGLYYHTHKLVEETNIEELTAKEAMRLKYLARLLFEQMERDEKIFLRNENFETPEEALALHQLMRSFHPRARLFLINVAPAHAPERVGRVIELRSGLYRGYISKPPDPERPDDRAVFEEWLKLCATVVAYERTRAGASPSGAT